MSAVLSTEAVSKRFGRRLAVDDVSLEIGPGQAFGFLGPNGAGKTTLIRMLVGLTRPSAGTVRLFGRPLDEDRAAILARVGAIVEEPRFHQHISARQNLRLSAAARGERAEDRVDVCLERCGLLDRADDRVREYSLGMRQRLGLARCLLGDPELLILDEPTNGLDPAGMVEFRRFVRELVDEGRTVFISTHLLDEIEKICDVAAIVHGGRIVASGSILELTDRGGRSRLVVGTERPADAIAAVAGLIESHRLIAPDTLELVMDPRHETPAGVIQRLGAAGIEITRVDHVRPSLEEIFLRLTAGGGDAA
jgi:ABC-2 type transport system ATP-binding protein